MFVLSPYTSHNTNKRSPLTPNNLEGSPDPSNRSRIRFPSPPAGRNIGGPCLVHGVTRLPVTKRQRKGQRGGPPEFACLHWISTRRQLRHPGYCPCNARKRHSLSIPVGRKEEKCGVVTNRNLLNLTVSQRRVNAGLISFLRSRVVLFPQLWTQSPTRKTAVLARPNLVCCAIRTGARGKTDHSFGNEW